MKRNELVLKELTNLNKRKLKVLGIGKTTFIDREDIECEHIHIAVPEIPDRLPAAHVIIAFGSIEQVEDPIELLHKMCNKLRYKKTTNVYFSYCLVPSIPRKNTLTREELAEAVDSLAFVSEIMEDTGSVITYKVSDVKKNQSRD